jgi:hypothetical protein
LLTKLQGIEFRKFEKSLQTSVRRQDSVRTILIYLYAISTLTPWGHDTLWCMAGTIATQIEPPEAAILTWHWVKMILDRFFS